ncbi:MAG TPA: Nramp family divalent metal transporter [Flexilinea sp.]|nr:Nramp family divalent metal transporter [Flexilinea sp.]HOG21611.1 Nramp family divalent metal transporter [Flexilinea sp.]HOR55620.1 Nramp family divalent metal transporter [Flexilinea sp.]HQJ00704.1 Nramp family divalent metal transporter [Flexilinea sp.]
MINSIRERIKQLEHQRSMSGLEILKYIGPGLLVTVGFIDPGNWASNVAAGSDYGYKLLWMVTLSTFMLIILQHNAAHLGIATGYCLSEASSIYVKPWLSRFLLTTALLATAATAMAEILGGAIALQMLFNLPLKIGAILVTALSLTLLLTNSYKLLERWIIGFVSLIGLSFIIEIILVDVDWGQAAVSWVKPSIPAGSIPVIMSVLGAVVMPHNLYLHSEIIQSRQWNLKDDEVIRHQLNYEFLDTIVSMLIGWAINSAMILVAAATFFANSIHVSALDTAGAMLKPLLGNGASVIFAIALLLAGISSSITAGMAGGTIFAGMFKEHYDIHDIHSRGGVIAIFLLALVVIFFIRDPFMGLVYSQMLLSIQLPWTIFLQIYLTSSKKVMGKFANSKGNFILLMIIGLIVTGLNIVLLISFLR